MKILISTQCFPPDHGGIEHVMGNLATHSSILKHDVLVLADQSRSPSIEFDSKNRFSIKRFDQIKYFRKFKKAKYINQLIREENFDRIFFDSWKSLEHVDNKYQSEKFICLVHGNEILKDKNHPRVIKSISKANTVIFNSNATQSLFRKKYASTNIKNPKVVYPAFIKTINQPDSEVKKYDFCTIARLDKRKGHLLVLKSLKILREKNNLTPSYAILGSGDELNNLKSEVLKLSLQNQVTFFSNEKADKIYKQSKIHLLPTFLDGNSIEGFGISNIEAASRGLPCIVSNSGGTPESVIKDKTGFVIKEKSMDALYQSMKELLENSEKYEQFSAESIKFSEKFQSKHKILEYLNVL